MRHWWPLLLLLFLCGSALSEPWYDELLFEYRREGSLLDFQQESADEYQAVVAYPLWKIVGGMESVLRDSEWVEEFTLQPDFAVLRTPRKSLNEPHQQVVLLAYSIDQNHTRLHFQVQGPSPTLQFEMLAIGLTASRYFGQTDRYLQVMKLSETSSRISTDPPFPFPPSSEVEPPEAVRRSLDPHVRPEYIVAQLQFLQSLKDQGKLNPSEFQLLEAGLLKSQ